MHTHRGGYTYMHRGQRCAHTQRGIHTHAQGADTHTHRGGYTHMHRGQRRTHTEGDTHTCTGGRDAHTHTHRGGYTHMHRGQRRTHTEGDTHTCTGGRDAHTHTHTHRGGYTHAQGAEMHAHTHTEGDTHTCTGGRDAHTHTHRGGYICTGGRDAHTHTHRGGYTHMHRVQICAHTRTHTHRGTETYTGTEKHTQGQRDTHVHTQAVVLDMNHCNQGLIDVTAILPAGQEVHGTLPEHFPRAVWDDPPPGNKQAAECGQVLCSPAAHRRHFLGGQYSTAPQKKLKINTLFFGALAIVWCYMVSLKKTIKKT